MTTKAFMRLLLLTCFIAANAFLCYRSYALSRSSILLGAIFPSLSESGDNIAFSYQGSIWRIPRDGGVMTQLTADEGFDIEPVWSPDGKRIAFLRGRGFFGGSLRLIDAESGASIPLPREVGASERLFFDRTGNRILGKFQRAGGGGSSLCWLDIKTGDLGPELRRDVRDSRFALSNDATQIALVTTQDKDGEQGGNNGPQCDLWKMPAGGGEPQKIVTFPGRVYEVNWSSNDRSLYVITNVGGVHNDVWEVPLDDPIRNARKLTFGQADEDRCVSTRDGRWLLYSDNSRGPTALVVRDIENAAESSLSVSTMNFLRPAGALALEISDEQEAKPVTARVSVRNLNGKYYTPPGSLYRMLRNDVHFYCNGRAEWDLPAGRYLVKVARGPEYAVVNKEFEITAGSKTSVPVTLKRWIHTRSKGWYSGESHIHANYGYGQWYNSPATMLAQCAGEDLVVANFMVANSEADGVFDREYFRGSPDPLSTGTTVLYWNEEFRSTIWGHLTLLNLKQLVEPIFTGFEHTTNPHDYPTNADIADLTHDQNGHANFTHPANNLDDLYLSAYSAKSLPLDVALGKIDSIDVMGSNYPASSRLWYRLLNCGFQIPASAGTDCFLNRVSSRLPGQDRAYVYIEGEFTYQRWIDSLRLGRTFVTNAPMFEFRVNNRLSGDTLDIGQATDVSVHGRVVSQYPLNRVEIIYNSEVAATIKITNEGLDIPVDERISIPASGWIALRASGPGQPEHPSGDLSGHTGPVYVRKNSKPIDARKDAQYFIEWIDRLHSDIRRRNRVPSRHQAHVESQIAAARKVYETLLKSN